MRSVTIPSKGAVIFRYDSQVLRARTAASAARSHCCRDYRACAASTCFSA